MVMTEEQRAEWVSISEAARRVGVSKAKLSRMAKQGRFITQTNPYDEREKLVDMNELRRIFPPREGM